MNIDPIDDGNDLFAISDVFPSELLTRLHTKDLNQYKWQREHMQEDLLRCKLLYNDSDILKEFDTFINKKDIIEQLSDTFSETFHGVSCNFWLDKPGYTISNHPDNPAVKHVIQIFLWPNNIKLGTTFYHNKTTTSEFDNNGSWEFPTDDNINNLKLRKKFDYQINTGYVMNNLYQIHGMTEPVPQDSIRFSLYGHIG
jgi:hypothetical protein